jgi:hypothetical protein
MVVVVAFTTGSPVATGDVTVVGGDPMTRASFDSFAPIER